MGDIPQSPALAEAGIDSLAELMSRDPEGYSQQDLGRVVQAMRDQRERLASAAASGPKPKAVKAGVSAKLITSAKIGDLDL